MKTATAAWRTAASLLLLAAGCLPGDRDPGRGQAASDAALPSTMGTHEGLIYGRVTLDDGTVYEGRIRWGGDEEALWGNYFNGFRDENPWVAQVRRGRLSVELFGLEISAPARQPQVGRPFMARFGDIARIEPLGRDIRVTLKSGTAFVLDRFSADDLADGVRVWDAERGVVDLEEWGIRSIVLLPAPGRDGGLRPLHGTVQTRQGYFTGLVQWDREQVVGSDALTGLSGGGERSVRFADIRSIERRGGDRSLVTLLDGREIVLTGTHEVGSGNRGLYVDDPRYGRVLVSWDAFGRVDFTPGGTGPAYGDFPPGHPLAGAVLTRGGRRFAGRLVFDLDESETTETLDAPSQGVDYTIPFGLVSSITLPPSGARDALRATVRLHTGEELRLDRAGDLGEGNAGLLIFQDGPTPPEYVPWADVERVDFDRPRAMYPHAVDPDR